jgi:hypothetical protein
MSWEQRLREMILAGGALAATACSGSAASPSDAGPDATSDVGPGAGDEDANNDANLVVLGSGCCNANSDPCCPMLCYGDAGPYADVYVACEQSWKDCLAMGGSYEQQQDSSLGCTPPDFPLDTAATPVDAEAGLSDAGPSDDAHD